MRFSYAIVVGASSGIGRQLASLLAASGCKVAAVARRLDLLEALAAENPGRIVPIVHDVTHFNSAATAFAQATQELGGLDLVVYAAGVMPEVGPREYNLEKDKLMVDVNLMGAIAWLNLAADRFEGIRKGSIVAIGSVAGERGRCGQPVYNTTKAALATYMEALRNRLARYGIRVVTIKPGPTKTDMTRQLHQRGMMPVDVAALKIFRLLDKTGEHYLKFSHKIAFLIIRNFPSFVFRRLDI